MPDGIAWGSLKWEPVGEPEPAGSMSFARLKDAELASRASCSPPTLPLPALPPPRLATDVAREARAVREQAPNQPATPPVSGKRTLLFFDSGTSCARAAWVVERQEAPNEVPVAVPAMPAQVAQNNPDPQARLMPPLQARAYIRQRPWEWQGFDARYGSGATWMVMNIWDK